MNNKLKAREEDFLVMPYSNFFFRNKETSEAFCTFRNNFFFRKAQEVMVPAGQQSEAVATVPLSSIASSGETSLVDGFNMETKRKKLIPETNGKTSIMETGTPFAPDARRRKVSKAAHRDMNVWMPTSM